MYYMNTHVRIIYMHIRTINEKRGHDLKKKQRRVYGRGWKGGRNDINKL